MDTTQPAANDPALPWSNSWRKIYTKAALDLGYQCRWGSGRLLISDKEGNIIGHVAPERGERTFQMNLLIKKAITERAEIEGRRQKDKERRLKQVAASTSPDWATEPPRHRMGLALTASIAAAMIPPHGR